MGQTPPAPAPAPRGRSGDLGEVHRGVQSSPARVRAGRAAHEARRSPTNQRYQKATAPSGSTRRSAASAKPKRVGLSRTSARPSKSSGVEEGQVAAATPVELLDPTSRSCRSTVGISVALWSLVFGGLRGACGWLSPPCPGVSGASLWTATSARACPRPGLTRASAWRSGWIWTKMRPMRGEWAKEQSKGKKS